MEHLLEYSRCVSMRQKVRRKCLRRAFLPHCRRRLQLWQQSVTVTWHWQVTSKLHKVYLLCRSRTAIAVAKFRATQ